MTAAPTVDDVRELDATDPLARFRDRFVIGAGPEDAVAYLDGNSLGRLPRATVDRLRDVVERQWGSRLIRGWTDGDGWLGLPERVGDLLGSAALGAAPGQVVVADSTTVNIAKALHAAAGLRADRRTLVGDPADFPTDRYLIEAVAAQRGMTLDWLPGGSGSLGEVLDGDSAAVLLSAVDYRSAEVADQAAITRQVHAAGAVVVWDQSHAAGAVPVRLDADEVDLAVGCTYKYLNAGPGAPAYLYAASRHHDALQNVLPGWIGADDVFAMADVYVPAPGVRRLLSGTPHVLGLVAVEEGARLVAEAGIEAIHAKGQRLTGLLIDLADAWLAPYGVEVASPRDPARRGDHVVLRHPEARRLNDELAERGVIGDFRNPDLWRLGLSPLTTSFQEVQHAMQAARDWMAGS